MGQAASAGISDGDVHVIRFAIGTLPPSLNQLERMHWAVKKRLRTRFAKEILYELWDDGPYPEPSVPGKLCMSTTIYWKTRRLDEDNAMGSLKIIIDAMRDIGLIYRDSPKWLKIEKPIQMIDRVNPRVEIELEELQSSKKGEKKSATR